MKRRLLGAGVHLLGNAAGLLLAALLLPGFSIQPLAFIVAVLVFTLVALVASPIISKVSRKYAPQVMGGISLVVTFVGLILTEMFVSGLTIGGIANLLAATLLVWLGSLAAQVLLPIFVFKELREKRAK